MEGILSFFVSYKDALVELHNIIKYSDIGTSKKVFTILKSKSNKTVCLGYRLGWTNKIVYFDKSSLSNTLKFTSGNGSSTI